MSDISLDTGHSTLLDSQLKPQSAKRLTTRVARSTWTENAKLLIKIRQVASKLADSCRSGITRMSNGKSAVLLWYQT